MRKQENNGEGAKKTKAETSYFAFFFVNLMSVGWGSGKWEKVVLKVIEQGMIRSGNSQVMFKMCEQIVHSTIEESSIKIRLALTEVKASLTNFRNLGRLDLLMTH